jgi:DNA-binding NtrC family response regulator
MAQLLDHAWPGNVRELAHAIERVVLLGREPEVRAGDLPSSVGAARPPEMPAALEGGVLSIREVQRRYAAWALEKLGGHKSRTAEALGIDTKTLAKWLSGDS